MSRKTRRDGGERQHTVTTADGVELQAWLAPLAKPSATLVLCHGLTTDSDERGAFPELREHSLRAGLAVARFDFRAHGLSGGTNEALRLSGLRADVDAVIKLLDAELGPDVPIIPLGLSFGSAPAVHAAATRSPCAGLALWYPVVDHEWNYGPQSQVPYTLMMRAAKRPEDPAWSAMPIPPTAWHFPIAMMAEMPTDPTLHALTRLTLPVLAYHGSRDSFVGAAPLCRLAAERTNIDLRMVPGAGHGFFLWRRWVIRRTVSWAAGVVRHASAPAPSEEHRSETDA